ncbi:MAG: outer membrane protein, partial [Roseivirga sp.]
MKKLIFTFCLALLVTPIMKAQEVLSLDECIKIALENNLEIKRARNNAIAAKANLTQSKFNFLPSLNAGASHNWNEGLQFDNTSGSLVNTTTLSGGGSIGGSVTLFDGFSNLLVMQRNKILYDASEETIKSNIQSTEASIVFSFLQVITTEENLKIAEQTRGLLSEQLDREEKR